MKRKKIIIIILTLIFIGISIVTTELLTKEKVNKGDLLENNSESTDEESNNVISEEINMQTEISQLDNSEDKNVISKENSIEKDQKSNINENPKNYTQEKTNKNITSNKQKGENISTVNDQKINTNDKKQQKVEEQKNETTNSTIKENPKKEENNNASLANTTYKKTNTEILPEIKRILEDEIKKDKELVDFGTKVIITNKSNAYSNTTGFTYMFVNKIEKGKVPGNYVKFEQRVRNNVGAFGKYYIYAEDEYVYNSEGKNPKWSQTLVWIYVRF